MTFKTRKLSFGLKYGDRAIIDCSFDDDIKLVTICKSKLLMPLNTLQGEAHRTGLSINWKMTKVMVVQPKSDWTFYVVSLPSHLFHTFETTLR